MTGVPSGARMAMDGTPPDGTVVTCAACSGRQTADEDALVVAVRLEVSEREVRPRPGDGVRRGSVAGDRNARYSLGWYGCGS